MKSNLMTSLAFFGVVALFISSTAQAAVREWGGAGSASTNSNWNTDGNWSAVTEPGFGDKAYFLSNGVSTVNIGNLNKTIGDGASSFRVAGTNSNYVLTDTTTDGDLTIDANDDSENNTLIVLQGGKLRVRPNIGTTYTHVYFDNSAATGNLYGKTKIATSIGTLTFDGDITANTSLTIASINSPDVLAINGTVHLASNMGIWFAQSAGAVSSGATFDGSAGGGNFLEFGDDVTMTAGTASLIGSSIERVGITGNGTVFTLSRNNGLQTAIDTLDTSGALVAGDRTFDLTTKDCTLIGTLTLSDGYTLSVDFSDAESNAVWFADSSAMAWDAGATLDLVGFDANTDELRFGTDANGLTAQQLSQITVDGVPGTYSLDSNGYFTTSAGAAPEIVETALVGTNTMKLVVSVSDALDSHAVVGRSDLVSGAWGYVAHSDDGINSFVVTNLTYSTSDGSNTVIYVQTGDPTGFFGIE